MRTTLAVVAPLTLGIAAVIGQAAQPSKPGPEHQKMAVWYGDWTYEQQHQTTPLGAGGTSTGRMTCKPLLEGYVAECFYEEKGRGGPSNGHELCWYDPVRKQYAYVYLGSGGYIEQGPFTMTATGNVTWEADISADGTAYKMRGVETALSGGTVLTRKAEISVDGKTWLPHFAARYTKVRAAPAPPPARK